MGHPSLPVMLSALTVPGTLWRARDDDRIECTACAHRCALPVDAVGLCGVRYRRDDELRVPAGYVAAVRIRAVETNTIYHVVPGTRALTFGMYGCDFRCPYCINWRISQALREPAAELRPRLTTPARLVEQALAAGCAAVCAAYNEPMIAAEWVRAVFAEARGHGLLTAVVSDGNTTPEALAYLRPVTDVYRVDLKGFTEAQYATVGGRLSVVVEAIRSARELGYWIEVVTLVVPGFNDDLQGLRAIARVLAAIDPAIPWHLNAFYPRYRWRGRPPQGAGLLTVAAGSAYAQGLRYVYVGNVANQVTQLSHTRCPRCHATVVERDNYRSVAVRLQDGRCPACEAEIPGRWASRPASPPSTAERA